ncbi:MAG: patatin-like phospholipase family protein [candidate division FCPU426 bacterium]
MPNIALALTGGGARAAYQAGVVRGLAELWPEKKSPFNIITGISAGSINACLLAHYNDDFKAGSLKLWDIWNKLESNQVIQADSMTQLKLALQLLRDLVLGGFFKSHVSSSLLNSAPLRKLIDDHVDFDRIRAHISSGDLKAFGVTATNYHNGCAITFFEGAEGLHEWSRSNHLSERASIGTSHIMASAAIPVFFPPIQINNRYYGDGSVRLLSPLSPSLHLGADRIVAVGIRQSKEPEQYREMESRSHADITFADIAGVFLNAIFLDSLESDLQRMIRINHTLLQFAPEKLSEMPGTMRVVPIQAIRPSRDLGTIASGNIERFPFLLRHLLRGIGARRRRGQDVLSYLAFDGSYCGKLLRMGYKDAMKRRDELLKFMKGE